MVSKANSFIPRYFSLMHFLGPVLNNKPFMIFKVLQCNHFLFTVPVKIKLTAPPKKKTNKIK